MNSKQHSKHFPLRALIFSLLGICGLDAATAHAQVGKSRYNWNNRNQLKSLLLSNINQPRATYNLLVTAGKNGNIMTAVETYDELLKQPKYLRNPYIQSAYALSAHFAIRLRFWDWKLETKPNGRLWKETAKEEFFRSEAVNRLPRSPEVLLSAALYYDSNGEYQKAIRMMEEAVRLAPTWADAHYWQASALGHTAVNGPKSQWKSYGTRMLRPLNRAEKLDPSLKAECIMERSSAYQLLGMMRAMLAAYDSYAELKPAWKKYPAYAHTRPQMVEAARREGTADG